MPVYELIQELAEYPPEMKLSLVAMTTAGECDSDYHIVSTWPVEHYGRVLVRLEKKEG